MPSSERRRWRRAHTRLNRLEISLAVLRARIGGQEANIETLRVALANQVAYRLNLRGCLISLLQAVASAATDLCDYLLAHT